MRRLFESTVSGSGALAEAVQGGLEESAGDRVAGGVSSWQVTQDRSGVYWSVAHGEADRRPIHMLRSAARRSEAWHDQVRSCDGPSSGMPEPLFVAFAGRQVAHDLVSSPRSAPPSRSVATVKAIDRGSLRTSQHFVALHPYEVPARQTSETAFSQDMSTLVSRAALTPEELAERWSWVGDSRFGAVADVDAGQLHQLPLKVSAARACDPCGLFRTAPVTVLGADVEAGTAEQQARLNALAAYGSGVVDPRLLLDHRGRYLCGAEDDPWPALSSVRDRSDLAFVRGFDIVRERTCLVPAAVAFPALGTPLSESCHGTSGAFAALSWEAALLQGLLSHCRQLTVAERSLSPTPPARRIDLDAFDQDPVIRYCMAMLDAAGVETVVHDITGPLGVPVVACTSVAGQTVHGCAAELGQAVRRALVRVLFDYQRHQDSRLEAVTAHGWMDESAGIQGATSAGLTAEQLTKALAGFGHFPVVVPLNHDPAVHQAVPNTLRVVLVRADV